MKRYRVLIALLALLAGCGAPAAPQPTAEAPGATPIPTADASRAGAETAAPAGTTGPQEAYPGPQTEHNPYPGPAGSPVPTTSSAPPPPTPAPIPTPSSNTGVVHGRLYNIQTDEPLTEGVLIYLSPVQTTDNPDMSAVALDPLRDRSTVPDAEGGFFFADVPPGRYGIVVQAPTSQYLTRFGNNLEQDVVITVEAGQTVKLEKIVSGYP
ncbi:MAG: hypothetical protein ACPL8I_03655 [Chloroflexaceae bacterium]